MSNFPLFDPQTEDPNESVPLAPTADPQELNIEVVNQIANQNPLPGIPNRRGRPRGRPPGRRNQQPTSSRGTTTSCKRPTT